MGVQVPTPEQVKAAATEVGLSLTVVSQILLRWS